MADNDWIGQIGAIVAPLLEQLSPRSAEAKVVPADQASADLIDAIEKGTVMPKSAGVTDPLIRGNFDTLSKQIYQQIMRTAQARPETSIVGYSNDVPGDALAVFNRMNNQIALKPYTSPFPAPGGRQIFENAYSAPPTAKPQQEIVTHELLHFLMKVLPLEMLRSSPYYPRNDTEVSTMLDNEFVPDVEDQHKLIQYLLGAGLNQPNNTFESFGKHKPLSIPPGTPSYLQDMLFPRIFPNQPLRGQVLQGLKGR